MVYIIFIASLVAVSKGADWMVEGAVSLTNLWGISQIVVGATIVSLGTTLPETLISAFAAAQGKGDVIVGTALGSILFNTAIILGSATIIKPPRLNDRDPFYKAGTMIGVLLLFGLLTLDQQLSRADGLLLGILLIIFLGTNIWSGTRNSKEETGTHSTNDLYKHLMRLIGGSALLVGGAHYLLDSGVDIARLLGIPEAIIAVTLFAVGSSLPELITAITAARKGHTDLVLGNILGANTLNIIFVISTAGLIRPFAVPSSVYMVDIPFSLIVMGVLFVPAVVQKKINRWQGLITVCAYFAYLTFLVWGS